MKNRSTFLISIAVFIIGHFSLSLVANPGGADPGNTGGPCEESAACGRSECHVGANNPTHDAGIEIEFPDGATYTPWVKQRWRVRVTEAANIFGFQVSARLPDDSQAGALVPADGRTQVLCADGRTPPCRSDAPIQYIVSFRQGCVGPQNLRFLSCQDAADGRSADAKLPGDLGFADANARQPARIGCYSSR